ncbi:hemerythrin domain-containing protein [Massilia cavernae]|uniref:Hemerythrin domain-containing protein n=1 Tax=Massilia cavernae TaxID=2320864 RepID=A0A418XA69_9BURK|nr:hemerythrin domain-containing protein [Massilia cavernae]RJG09374.1 hemerythrin domain-containing protein [Massilia cavernae]
METLASYLEQDHVHCDALFRATNESACAGRWPQATREMAAFQHALERHLLIEERILYPAYENALGHAAGPTLSMRAEHLRIRAVVQRLTDAVRAQDRVAFFNHADAFLLMMHQHSEKEEGIVYPRIARVLAHASNDLLSAMRAYGTYEGSTRVA